MRYCRYFLFAANLIFVIVLYYRLPQILTIRGYEIDKIFIAAGVAGLVTAIFLLFQLAATYGNEPEHAFPGNDIAGDLLRKKRDYWCREENRAKFIRWSKASAELSGILFLILCLVCQWCIAYIGPIIPKTATHLEYALWSWGMMGYALLLLLTTLGLLAIQLRFAWLTRVPKEK